MNITMENGSTIEFFETRESITGSFKAIIYIEHEGKVVKIVGGKVVLDKEIEQC